MHSVVESSDRVAPPSLVSWSGSSMNASGPGMRGMPMGAGLLARLHWWWRGLPETARLAPLASLATIAILALLLAFVSEVHEAVRQGAMRSEATSALAGLTWRCNAVQDANARQDCLSRLPLAPSRGAMRGAQTESSLAGTTVTTVAGDARKAR